MTLVSLRIAVLVIAGVLSAAFSGSETALFSLPPDEVRRMRGAGGVAGIAARLLGHPKRLLTTVLLGNTVVNVIFYSVSFFLLVEHSRSLGPVATAALGVATPLAVIVFCELLPKNIAISFARPLSRWVAWPLALFQRAAWPAIYALEKVTDGIASLLGRRLRPEPIIRADELAMLIDLTAREGVVDPDVGEMVTEVVKLSGTAVPEIMVPRVDMVCFDAAGTPDELERLFSAEKHTLIPLYEGQMDNVVGVVHAKDLLLRDPSQGLRELLRATLFLPETTTVEAALQEFRLRRTRMGLVVDEHGALVGLITLEDVLEEIVGEIRDEYDSEERPEVEELGGARYRVRGDLSVQDLEEFCGVELPERSVDTVGGLVMALLDRVPTTGDAVRSGGLTFTVERTRGRRVVSVFVEWSGPPEGEGGAQQGGGGDA